MFQNGYYNNGYGNHVTKPAKKVIVSKKSSQRKTTNTTSVKPTTSVALTPSYVELTAEYKTLIRENSYFGSKGLTIPKSILTEQDIQQIKRDLTIKPEKHGVDYGGVTETDEYPVFRENEKKIYIPRFYGIERYGGNPAKTELTSGIDINLQFHGTLRPLQEDVVTSYMNTIHHGNGIGGVISLPCGMGKTITALHIISRIQKKTLVIVHKGFLADQWIDSIREYLPNARVGRIQGQIYDVEGKDIVIGMLQTLYDKDFPFQNEFGLMIVDECHHIVSSQFSRALCKIITPHTLGLSATLDRKDKLDKVLYMFMGEIVFKIEREQDDPVCVRGIQYICNDTEFNEVEYDFRGNVKYSTMISKLCGYQPRSRFIIDIVRDLLLEEPDNQIMLLAHQRDLLTFFYETIGQMQLASCGYYVGGMKQQELQESESKQIVLATYSMASEGLNIKTLSTLILCTPKTDVVQSVGRILRIKHQNPRVIDIVDSHDVFQRQWQQRRKFYKKCNYRIRMIQSPKYLDSRERMKIDWNADKTLWTRIFEPHGKYGVNHIVHSGNKDDSCDTESGRTGKCLFDLESLGL